MDLLTVILPAAGLSTRFGAARNKLLELLGDRPVIAHAAAAFLARPDVDRLIIPTNDRAVLEPILANLKPGPSAASPRLIFCPGGTSRASSVLSAVGAAGPDTQWIAVHDAARPLVSADLIDRTFAAARRWGAAVGALPVHLTIKEAAGPLPAKVRRTLPRHQLWAMQTPQIMRASALAAAFDACPIPLDQVTDDVQLLELAGHDVWLVDGEERNLKITTPNDLALARLLL